MTKRVPVLGLLLSGTFLAAGGLTAYALTENGTVTVPAVFVDAPHGTSTATPFAGPTPGDTGAAPASDPSLPPPLGPNSQVVLAMPTPTPSGPVTAAKAGELLTDGTARVPDGLALWKQPDGKYLVTDPKQGVTPMIAAQLAPTVSAALSQSGGALSAVAGVVEAFNQAVVAATGTRAVVVFQTQSFANPDQTSPALVWQFWAATGDTSTYFSSAKGHDETVAAAQKWASDHSTSTTKYVVVESSAKA